MTGSFPPNVTFDFVKEDEVTDAHNLLKQEFPEGEAATLEQFKMRQEFAPSLFLGAFLPPPSEDSKRVIIGFVCATRSKLPTSTGESIEKHDPNGSSVCIHAVVVASQYQRCGIALALLKEYVARMRIDGSTNRLLLICNENTRALYEKAGFEYVEPSPVVHGPLPWGEMRIILDDIQGEKKEEEPRNAESQSPSNTLSGFGSEPLPPGLLEALQRSISSRNRPSARLLSSFLGSVDDVTNDSDGVKSNKYGILCPRLGCGCLILKAGVGTLVEKELPELEQAGKPPAGLLATLPPTGRSVSCWLVQPNPMVFENICFSRAIDRGTGTQVQMLKLLSCADCNLGPLGWCVADVPEFWLLCERVGYRHQENPSAGIAQKTGRSAPNGIDMNDSQYILSLSRNLTRPPIILILSVLILIASFLIYSQHFLWFF